MTHNPKPMARSAYGRWLAFISKPHSQSGLVFPSDEARAIMALPEYPNWRRDKREINKAAQKARDQRRSSANPGQDVGE